MKKPWADKWSVDVLEQVASTCNIASKAETVQDWELFLNALYESAVTLPKNYRIILLLSQEHSLSFSDIGRTLGMSFNAVRSTFKRAVEMVVEDMRDRSLLNTKLRDSKIGKHMYSELVDLEASDAKTRTGFYHNRELPWFFHGKNPLID